jgi:uncharacterized membrane protein
MNMNTRQLEKSLERELHVSFYIVAYKFISGFLELILGMGILFFEKNVLAVYHSLVIRELLEDPRDFLVSISQKIIPYVLTRNRTLSIFLILIGLVKVIGAVGLIYKKDWGVDLLIVITLFFIPFQLWNVFNKHSLPDLIYLVLGIFISLYLINFKPGEYSTKFMEKIKNLPRSLLP